MASNRADAPVLQMAAQKDVEVMVLDRPSFYQTQGFLDALHARGVTWVVLAGFLWLVPDYLVQAYHHRMVNIHPALLPRFGGKGMYGMHVHRAVHASRSPESGITIHWVNPHYDEGDIIFQASCGIGPEDSPTTIARKVQQLEHRHFAPVLERLMFPGQKSRRAGT